MRLLSTFVFVFFILLNGINAQNNDCGIALVICDNNQISYNPNGPGNDDFSSGSNDSGCLEGFPQAEHQSAWYYFEFRADMPVNSIIEFVIDPEAGVNEDYDFAIYGPNPSCNDLGSPIRCSYADSGCDLCPQTGLGMGALDASEDFSGNGFLLPLTVQPGQGYYLLVDNWLGSSTSGFAMEWSGSAAEFLNCEATPECNITLTQPGVINLCAAPDPTQLTVNVGGNMGITTYDWTATNGGAAYLSATDIVMPTLTIPAGVSGDFVFTVEVEDEVCMRTIDVEVEVAPVIAFNITGETEACEGQSISLSSSGIFSSYQWSTGETGSTISVTNNSNVFLQVTNAQNCTATETISVLFNSLPQPQITGDDNICSGESATLSVEDSYVQYAWSNAQSSPEVMVTNPGDYTVTVTDDNGCEGSSTKNLIVMSLPVFQIIGDEIICDGDNTTLSTGGGVFTHLWSTGDDTPTITVGTPGTFEVTVTDQNNCSSNESFEVVYSNIQIEFTQQDPLCFGDDNGLIRIDQISGGQLPYQYSWQSASYEDKNFISGLVPGEYILNVLDGADCEIEERFTIIEGFDLTLALEGDSLLTLGAETSIRAIVNSTEDEITSINWFPADIFDCLNCMEQELFPLNSNIIYVDVEDIRGCKATQQINIIVDKPRNVFVPNAFSPNDDGINDVLKVFTGDDVELIKSFVIFDRWGEMIFEQNKFDAEDLLSGWTGAGAKKFNTGTYVYTTEVLFIDGVTKRYSGEVHLLR